MEFPGVLARLNKAGTHVVYGKCFRRIASVGPTNTEDETPGYVQFPIGFAPTRDGVWGLSNHALRRLPKGLDPKNRREAKWGGFWRGNDVMDSQYDPLPAVARCPNCRIGNVLTTAKIGVPYILRRPPPRNCSELRGSEQPAAFQEGIETSGPPGAKEGCQGHLAVGALP